MENIKQRSLGDALIVEHKALTEHRRCHALINWPLLMMFKALLLQSSCSSHAPGSLSLAMVEITLPGVFVLPLSPCF